MIRIWLVCFAWMTYACIHTGLFAVNGSASEPSSNYPQFRGAAGNASSIRRLPTVWSDDDSGRINIRWKIPVDGEGWSQPIVWDDVIYLTAAVPQGDATDATVEPYRGGGGRSRLDLMDTIYRYTVTAIDANTGQQIWQTVCKTGTPPVPRHNTNTYATETPVTDGRQIYAYFGMNGVYALDRDGSVVWFKDLGVYPMRADWGTASSPVVHDDKLFIQMDNQENSFLVALDTSTGDEIWRVGRDEKSQYSTPFVWRNSVRDELIVGGMVYRSHDPETGGLLWQLDMNKGRSSATPVAEGDRLYVGNEFRNRGGADDGGGRLFCVLPGGEGDITPPEDASQTEWVDWWIERADLQMASPTVCQGRLYLLERRTGNLHCVDTNDGSTVYRQRIRGAKAFWASPWTDGVHVYALDSDGTTHVISGGESYQLVAANDLAEQTWGTPAIAGGRIYLRTLHFLYCIEALQPTFTEQSTNNP